MTIESAITSRTGNLGRSEYLVRLYDTQSPRIANCTNPALRYACVSLLGPFKSRDAAENVAQAYPALGTADNTPTGDERCK